MALRASLQTLRVGPVAQARSSAYHDEMRFHLVIGVILSIAACGDDDAPPDASVMDAGPPEAGRDGGPSDASPPDAGADAHVPTDLGVPADAADAARDFGAMVDAGTTIDGGSDAGPSDLGTAADSAMADLGAPDTGVIDAGGANACINAPVVGSGTYAVTVPSTISPPSFLGWCAVGEETQVTWLSAVIPPRSAVRLDFSQSPTTAGDVRGGIRHSCASTQCQGGEWGGEWLFHFPASLAPQPISIPIGGASGTGYVTIAIPDAVGIDSRPAGVAGQVACGATSCAVASHTCCAETQTCGMTTSPVVACGRTAATLRCDGPEDCSGGQVCCAHQWPGFGNYTRCSTECRQQPMGALVRPTCHNDADCPATHPFCEPSSYAYFHALPIKYCMRPCVLDFECASHGCEMRTSGRYAAPLC